jgi:hypothetical protein
MIRYRPASAAGTENGWSNSQPTRNVRELVKNGFGFLVLIAAAFIVGSPRAMAEGANRQSELPPLFGPYRGIDEAWGAGREAADGRGPAAGQGTAVSWNPYVAAAKFVVHQVRGEDSLQLLADQIAQKILDERQTLLIHDAPSGGVSNQ